LEPVPADADILPGNPLVDAYDLQSKAERTETVVRILKRHLPGAPIVMKKKR
jgi:hypothetical protein